MIVYLKEDNFIIKRNPVRFLLGIAFVNKKQKANKAIHAYIAKKKEQLKGLKSWNYFLSKKARFELEYECYKAQLDFLLEH